MGLSGLQTDGVEVFQPDKLAAEVVEMAVSKARVRDVGQGAERDGEFREDPVLDVIKPFFGWQAQAFLNEMDSFGFGLFFA